MIRSNLVIKNIPFAIRQSESNVKFNVYDVAVSSGISDEVAQGEEHDYTPERLKLAFEVLRDAVVLREDDEKFSEFKDLSDGGDLRCVAVPSSVEMDEIDLDWLSDLMEKIILNTFDSIEFTEVMFIPHMSINRR